MTLRLSGEQLTSVLREIGRQAQLNIVIDTDLDKVYTGEIEVSNQPWPGVVKDLSKKYCVEVVRHGNILRFRSVGPPLRFRNPDGDAEVFCLAGDPRVDLGRTPK